jgi:DNA-directed RNA polymerase subunit beta
MERDVAANSGLIVRAARKGTVTYVDATSIEITPAGSAGAAGVDTYELRKYSGLNERTCQSQKPIIALGQKVEKGEVIADGAATYKGELALGRNVLVGFMAWDGFNFEDAIIISEELVEDDVYTSIHIEEYDIEIRDTKLGREEFTRDIPNVGERALHNLDENGIVRIGTYVRPGDILVGKVSPKSKTELSPEEKLLHAIFGRAGEDVKNDSLDVPSGVEGIVIATEKFSRQMSLSEDERKEFQQQLRTPAISRLPRPSQRWSPRWRRSPRSRSRLPMAARSFATRTTRSWPNGRRPSGLTTSSAGRLRRKPTSSGSTRRCGLRSTRRSTAVSGSSTA